MTTPQQIKYKFSSSTSATKRNSIASFEKKIRKKTIFLQTPNKLISKFFQENPTENFSINKQDENEDLKILLHNTSKNEFNIKNDKIFFVKFFYFLSLNYFCF